MDEPLGASGGQTRSDWYCGDVAIVVAVSRERLRERVCEGGWIAGAADAHHAILSDQAVVLVGEGQVRDRRVLQRVSLRFSLGVAPLEGPPESLCLLVIGGRHGVSARGFLCAWGRGACCGPWGRVGGSVGRVPKVGVLIPTSTAKGGRVIADLDTRSGELYGPVDEVLPQCGLDLAVAERSSRVGERFPAESCAPNRFAGSRELFDAELDWLAGEEAAGFSHGELEDRLLVDSRELHRRLLEEHLGLRAEREVRIGDVRGGDGERHGNLERSHERPLVTVFGEVGVRRLAYRARGRCNLYPSDGELNLPVNKHSHGLARLCAIESARGSFDDAVAAVERASGQRVAKRQLEQLAQAGARDFEGFYAARQRDACEPGDAILLSCDGKGVVMRPEALREATRRQAQNAKHKLKTRLSRGEKRGRKRIAEVGAVYEITPVPRAGADIMPLTDSEREAQIPAPAAKRKWLTASVAGDAAHVVSQVFDEAERRDTAHQRTWVALVDGNNHQIDRINAEASAREANVTVVIDFIHVLEYVWKAAWSFHREGDPAAETWVRRHAQNILAGNATRVAGQIRREATNTALDPAQRAGADACASYLTHKQAYLDYPTALSNGWPIATGIIEGACRHLVKDRMDITGARWGLDGAEAILELRAIHNNGDFDQYWRYHLDQEQHRNHRSRYADQIIPSAK